MKRILSILAIALLLSSPALAGVVKKTRSEVTFKKFGKFTTVQSEKISGDKKVTHSENNFKGKGILGGLAAKAFLKSGEVGEIINLADMIIYKLDHKKKEYRINPIRPILEREAQEGIEAAEDTAEEIDASEEADSNIRIIRNEFKVEESGESRVINQFPSKKYSISWIMEWEDLRTGQKGTDRLLTDVWTTPLTGSIKQAQEEEVRFSKDYMNKLGFDMDELQQAILGTNWLSILGNMSDEGKGLEKEAPKFTKELKKIKGYPVVIDGKYYSTREGGMEEEEEEEGGGVKKLFGGFAKKALKKKLKSKDSEPLFSYYTELLELKTASVGDEAFQVPSNYKKKG